MPRAQLPPRICSRPFGQDELKIVRNIVGDGQGEGIHRSEIARRVCLALNWRNARGSLKEMGARVALLRLHRLGWIALPEPRDRNGNADDGAQRLARAPVPEPPASQICISLAQLGTLRLQQVENRGDSLLWDGFIDRYHYLGHTPLSGARIRYLIHADRGVIGAIGFGAAAFALKARDRWIGWDRRQRDRRRERILNNRRFLILPWIRVANLASHILSRAGGQVQADFPTRYGYAPLLLETFVEQDRFTGGCYRAANWIDVGRTAGRGRNDRRHRAPLAIKRIWLHPLRRDRGSRRSRSRSPPSWRKRNIPRGRSADPVDPADQSRGPDPGTGQTETGLVSVPMADRGLVQDPEIRLQGRGTSARACRPHRNRPGLLVRSSPGGRSTSPCWAESARNSPAAWSLRTTSGERYTS